MAIAQGSAARVRGAAEAGAVRDVGRADVQTAAQVVVRSASDGGPSAPTAPRRALRCDALYLHPERTCRLTIFEWCHSTGLAALAAVSMSRSTLPATGRQPLFSTRRYHPIPRAASRPKREPAGRKAEGRDSVAGAASVAQYGKCGPVRQVWPSMASVHGVKRRSLQGRLDADAGASSEEASSTVAAVEAAVRRA